MRLNGGIERGRRLVGDQQFGLAGDGDGAHHALAHAAAELMGIIIHPGLRRRHPHPPQTVDDAVENLFAIHPLMQAHRFGDLKADAEDRVQARHGILQNERDAPTPDAAHFGFALLQQVLAVKPDRAADDAPVGPWQQTQNG